MGRCRCCWAMRGFQRGAVGLRRGWVGEACRACWRTTASTWGECSRSGWWSAAPAGLVGRAVAAVAVAAALRVHGSAQSWACGVREWQPLTRTQRCLSLRASQPHMALCERSHSSSPLPCERRCPGWAAAAVAAAVAAAAAARHLQPSSPLSCPACQRSPCTPLWRSLQWCAWPWCCCVLAWQEGGLAVVAAAAAAAAAGRHWAALAMVPCWLRAAQCQLQSTAAAAQAQCQMQPFPRTLNSSSSSSSTLAARAALTPCHWS